MSRIAIYEKRQGKQDIPMNGYYKSDYVRLNTLKAVVSATLVYFIVLAMVAAYKLDFILANILKMDYKRLGLALLVIYLVWILIYWVIARIVYAKRYEDARPNIIIYNHRLKKLQEESRKDIVKAKGGVVIDDDFIDF